MEENNNLDQQEAVETLSAFLSILNNLITDKYFTNDEEIRIANRSIELISDLVYELNEITISDNPGRFILLDNAKNLRKAYKKWTHKWWVPKFLNFTALSVGRSHLMDLLGFEDNQKNTPEIIQIMPGLTDKNEFKLMMIALTADKQFIFPKNMNTIPKGSSVDGDVSDDYRPCPPHSCNDIV